MGLTRDAYAIAGLGVTKQGRVPGVNELQMKCQAVKLAAADAGIRVNEIDGWIYQPGFIEMVNGATGGEVPKVLGFEPSFMWQMQTGGCTAIAGIAAAMGAIDAGLATYVAVSYGDAALSGQVLVGAKPATEAIQRDLTAAYGMFSPGASHALAAARHMHQFGTTKEQLGSIALQQREYAQMRPDAYMHGRPMTMQDYLEARPIAAPLGKYDYCLTADGGSCVIVCTAERARALKTTPVLISGLGFGHSVGTGYRRTQFEEFGIKRAKEQTLKMAGVSLDEIDVAEIYDCFSITVLLTVEDWGFCKKGEGGPWLAEGNMRLSAKTPMNTAGGELSWSYMQGFTPMVEGVRQTRGEGGPTQVKDAELCLVTGHGGTTKNGGGYVEYAEAGMILRRG